MEMLKWESYEYQIDRFTNEDFNLKILKVGKRQYSLFHEPKGASTVLCENKSFDFCLGYANGFADKNRSV